MRGHDLSTQTLAAQIGHVTFALRPLFDLIEVMYSTLSGFTAFPILAKANERPVWIYVRDDQPFAGPAPPAGGSLLRFQRPARRGSASLSLDHGAALTLDTAATPDRARSFAGGVPNMLLYSRLNCDGLT